VVGNAVGSLDDRAAVEVRMRRALLLAAALGISGPAMATLPRWNPKAPQNSQVLPAFTVANVSAVLTSVGARHQRSNDDADSPALTVVFPNGRRALVTLSSCERGATACKALSVQSFWTKLEKVPPEKSALAIEQFNQRYAFAKAYITADGRPTLQRYLTADYGFIRGNLAVNLLVFADQAERLATEVLQPLQRGNQ
jgi:hypothetical protein